MTRDILIGIDAGTSVIKSVAFTLAGEQIAVAARPNIYATPGGGQVEQDMLAHLGRLRRDAARTHRARPGPRRAASPPSPSPRRATAPG